MRYLNRRVRAALLMVGLVSAGAVAAQQRPVGVPAVAPPGGDTVPPPAMPGNGGPSATSGAAAEARFDDVGYAAIGGPEMRGVGVAIAGIRPGSDIELTALDSGHIILAMAVPGAPPPGRLALLSPGAARALGVSGQAVAIRAREVQPQAGDEAALRRGEAASPRLSAPNSLLVGLRARLGAVASPLPSAAPVRHVEARPENKSEVASAPRTAPPATHLKPPTARPARESAVRPLPKSEPPKPAPSPAAKAPPSGPYHVQVGTFSNEGNARKLAAKLGGHVDPAGKFWRVVLGPFADDHAAQQARDVAAKHGYGGAEVRKD